MQIERTFIHTSKPGESCFGISPKALDSIDMTFIMNKLILSMVDSKVFLIPEINEPVVAPPAVRMDYTFKIHTTSDNRLQRGSSAIWNNLCVDFSVSFEDTKDDCFSGSSTASTAFNTMSAKVAFIDFDFTTKR